MDAQLSRRAVRPVLAGLSVVAMMSIGGGFFAGVVLVPLLVLATRHVSRPASGGYLVLAALLAAEVSWGTTYLLVQERQPYIWLAPSVVGVATAIIGWRIAGAHPKVQAASHPRAVV